MRAIPTLKISVSGVRGVVGESLTPEMVTRFAQALGTYVGGGRVVIGRDPRTSGEMVRQAVVAGLVSSGCRVSDLGVCPTPTVQLLVRELGASGGIAITASHNPPEWNALKFVGSDGLFLSAARGRELLDIYHQGDYVKAAGAGQRPPERIRDAVDRHVQAVVSGIGRLPEGAPRPKVVVDPGGGAASVAAPRLVEALGAEVEAIYTTADGHFPRPAEPVVENLGALGDAVRAHGADVGFAQDMDGDRLAIVDATGTPIGEELTLVLAAEQVLAHTPGPITANVATTDAVEAMASRYGVAVNRTRVGEANVAEGMRHAGAVIGGEGNGGVLYPKVNFGRDSLVGMALVLHRLAETGRSVRDLAAPYDVYRVVKILRPCPIDRARVLLVKARELWAEHSPDLLDGVKVRLPEGWFIIRPSNTEPVVRVIAEAATEDAARGLAEQAWTLATETLDPPTGD
jgi:phosphomannomutase